MVSSSVAFFDVIKLRTPEIRRLLSPRSLMWLILCILRNQGQDALWGSAQVFQELSVRLELAASLQLLPWISWHGLRHENKWIERHHIEVVYLGPPTTCHKLTFRPALGT